MAKIIKPKHILDLNSNKGIGIDLPFNGDQLFDINYLTKDQIKANLVNLFLTNPGERLQNPIFGVGLKKLVFENNISSEKVENMIENQVEIYIPDINIIKVEVDFNNDENKLNILFEYSLKFNEETEQIQITLE